MGCRVVALRSLMLTESRRSIPACSLIVLQAAVSVRRCGELIMARNCHHHHYKHNELLARKKTSVLLNCSHSQNNPSSSSSSSSSSHHHNQNQDPDPPQEAVLKAISEVSKTVGRVGQTTNVVIGGTVTDDETNEWLTLDQKVNSYPTVRGFTAIGTGGEDFVQAMIVAVETVLQQPIPEGQVKQKISSGGKYVSVNIGPVQVVSSEQVQAIYNAMRRDDRMKYFL